MNRLVGVLFFTAACSSVAAPHLIQPVFAARVVQASGPSQEKQATHDKPSDRFKPEFNFDITLPPTKVVPRSGAPSHAVLVIAPPRHVFKDGALYLDVLGNGTLVPVPGGGASGCFDRDLHQRIEKLKTAIEALPPSPTVPRR